MCQTICCVSGCFVKRESGIALHRFPNPEINLEKFCIWVSNIGGELINMDMTEIYIYKRVCHNHFEDIHKYTKNRLSKLATPILGLQGGKRDLYRVDAAGSYVLTSSDTLNKEQHTIKLEPSGSDEKTDQDRVDAAGSSVLTFSDTLNIEQHTIKSEPSGSGGKTDQDMVDAAGSSVLTFGDTLNIEQHTIKLEPSGSSGKTDQDMVDAAGSSVLTFGDTLNIEQHTIKLEPSDSGSQKSYGHHQPKKVKKNTGLTVMEIRKFNKVLKELKKCEVEKAELKKNYLVIKKHIKNLKLQLNRL